MNLPGAFHKMAAFSKSVNIVINTGNIDHIGEIINEALMIITSFTTFSSRRCISSARYNPDFQHESFENGSD